MVWCEEGKVRCSDEKGTIIEIKKEILYLKCKGKKYYEKTSSDWFAIDGDFIICSPDLLLWDGRCSYRTYGDIKCTPKIKEIPVYVAPYYTIHENKKYIYKPDKEEHTDWNWQKPIYLKEPYTELRLIIVIILNGILLVYTLGNENFRKIFK